MVKIGPFELVWPYIMEQLAYASELSWPPWSCHVIG